MARILLVEPGLHWCFKWMAEEIARYAGPDHHIMHMTQPEFEAIAKWAKPDALGRLDAAFHFSLGSASILRRVKAKRYGALVANEGWCYAEYIPGAWQTNATASERNAVFGKQVAAPLDFVICLTKRIHQTVSQWNEGAVAIPQGLDCRFWAPTNRQRPEVNMNKITVGWCGDISGPRSFKGHSEILMPLMERQHDGITWDVNTLDYTKARSRTEMRAWYQRLDVFACTAINEGGPYPPFEAAACGCAVVSTDVGIVAEWDAIHELDMIAPPATMQKNAKFPITVLADRLERLRDDSVLREKCGNVLRNSVIEHYNWERLAPRWVEGMIGNV